MPSVLGIATKRPNVSILSGNENVFATAKTVTLYKYKLSQNV